LKSVGRLNALKKRARSNTRMVVAAITKER
jgi:hypothetical protein